MKFRKNCARSIEEDDTLVLVGDHSWGKNLEECEPDLQYIRELPGRKILTRGNHDMFWEAKKTGKLNALYQPQLTFLQDSYKTYRDYAIVGTKGFTFEGPFYLNRRGQIVGWDEEAEERAKKLVKRELVRLRKSFNLAQADGFRKFIMFLHYPPTSILEERSAFTDMAEELGGAPVALQDFLVGISFLVILAIVNSLGVIASAGVGVAEKVCAFIMLIPSAFAQSMSAFVSQNRGAGKYDRAFKGLRYAIGVSFIFAVLMFYSAFFHGDLLSGIFAKDVEVVAASWDYLKAYAIDCLFTCFLFCFIGFFNGMEYTRFVMIQGIVGAFLVRIPVSYIMSKKEPVSLFHIGLATPCSTVTQIAMCFLCLLILKKKLSRKNTE